MFDKEKDKVTGTPVPRWTFSTVRKDRKDYNVTTVRDANGDIISITFTDKHSLR